MEPITTAIAFDYSSGNWSVAHYLLHWAHGLTYSPSGPTTFSFSDNGFLGRTLSFGGQPFSLKPDFISRAPSGQSYSVFNGLYQQGYVGQINFQSEMVFGGGLQPQLATSIGASLKGSNLM